MSGNTTDGTTIRLSKDTKELLEHEQRPDESSFDETVRRLIGAADGQLWTEKEIIDIVDRRIEEQARR